MKPKATLNLLKKMAIDYKKNILVFLSFAFKKGSLSPSSLIYVFVMLLLLSTSIAFSRSNYNARLIMDHDINVSNSSPTGTYYQIMITNEGSSLNILSLSASNIDSNCYNTDINSIVDNLNLENSSADINLKPKNEISVAAGQTVNFYSHQIIPVGNSK